MPAATSALTISGHIRATLHTPDGTVVGVYEGDNLVVNGGLTALAHLLAGDGQGGPVLQMALGIGSGSVAAGDTALFNEPTSGVVSVRKSLSSSNYTVTPASGTTPASITWTAQWMTTEDNYATNITEVGLFSSGPTLFSHFIFPSSIPKNANLAFTVNYQIILQAS